MIAFVVATMLPLHLSAQKQARTLFVNMPDSVLPYLTSVNRADFVDFLDSKMKAKVKNRFGQESEMTALSPDYIQLQLSPESTWQMKLLPVNDSTQVICVVRSVCATACDSSISFYSTDWLSLPTSDYLPSLPEVKDFFSPAALTDESLQPSLAAFDIRLLSLSLSPDDTSLTVTLTTADYVPTESLEKLESSLSRSKRYEWKEGRYESLRDKE
jgi:hypothetical protein